VDSEFCVSCGAPLGAAGSPPPLVGAGESSPATPAGYPPPLFTATSGPPPSRRHRGFLIVVVIVAVVLLSGVLAFVFLAAPSLRVEIATIDFFAPDNVCGLNANPIGTTGYNDTTSTNTTVDFLIPNFNSTACEIRGVATNTSGFALYDAQVPRTIPGSASAQFNVTIKTPSWRFVGNLNLVLR
jgi:hypothetical protein